MPSARAVVPAALPRIATRSSGRPRSGGSARNASHTPPVRTESRRQTECTATPSFRYSSRRPSSSSTTWMYWWYEVSSCSRPSFAFTAPGGSATRAARSAATTRERAPSRNDEERALRPDRRDEDERRKEGAEQRPGGRERVEPAGDGSCSLDARDGEPDRERGHHPEEDHRRGKEQQHGGEAPHDGSGRRLVQPLHGQIEE